MWFIIGLIIGALILGLVWSMKRNNFQLTWYEWLIGIIGLALILFTIQNFFGSLDELESKAASIFLLVVGLPGLILLAVSWQLAARRIKKA
ncbi:MAG: dehalogenase [Dehalococcoides mccartyi]|uniref:dehalogenase n=1 Tax=Dehalococcoides TaxID=61434 RepID=UPI001A02ACC7|nr:dehalogenase [Dehalococcoides mccartyi]MBF4482083.1 dehalogenase [Dehalococcoides mccartyi]MBJ7531198.1 dehalogenase [Dehalococcoides mccartyi]MDP4279703.1 dehalogenase [Dehalococcoides mccartyi]